jgi:nucleoside-diphosphate-sugar epimerase
MYSLPIEDLEHVFFNVGSIWPQSKTFLITGGTGFFGRWILESIAYIETKKKSQNKYIVISRQPTHKLIENFPVLRSSHFQIVQQDMKSAFTIKEYLNYVIHAAVDVSKVKSSEKKDFLDDVLITENILAAVGQQKLDNFIYVSSGGVYVNSDSKPKSENSTQTLELKNISTYSQAKRKSEILVEAWAKKTANSICLARCFSFVGPFADKNMAAMDMLHAKSENLSIKVNSPGVVRSYMYPTDLVIALLRLLFSKNKYEIYNIGSDHAVTLKELAEKISRISTQSQVIVADNEVSAISLAGNHYVPEVSRARGELENFLSINLDQALTKTYNFLIQDKRQKHEKF